MYENRRWVIIPTSMIDLIDFSQIIQTNLNSLRYSIDGSKTLIKYDLNIVEQDETHTSYNPETHEENTYTIQAGIYGRPSFITSEFIEYTYEQILEILNGTEWNNIINI